jgi:radical SAM protein with 4Fe4S-binding SPASM domain
MNVFSGISLLDCPDYSKYLHYTVQPSRLDRILNIFQRRPDPGLQSRPLMLICETVNICNHRCIICPYDRLKREHQVMGMDLFQKVLRDYTAMGGGYLSLTPVVGDIFFDPHLVKRIALISDYPSIKSVSVTTNAVYADRFSDDDLKSVVNRLDRIHISVYGLDEQEYCTMTRRDTYHKMLCSIRKIVDLTDRDNVAFGFRLLKNRTGSEIQTWIEENFGSSYPYSCTTTYSNWGGSLDESSDLPGDAQWAKKIQCAEPCLIPLLAAQVFSNGDVSFCPCADYEGDRELLLGNIATRTLGEIYNSDRTKNLWLNYPKVPDFCKNCSFYRPLSDLKENEHILEHPLDLVGG